jgi:hypothetical protein
MTEDSEQTVCSGINMAGITNTADMGAKGRDV